MTGAQEVNTRAVLFALDCDGNVYVLHVLIEKERDLVVGRVYIW
jgi:hypothetical protein